MLLIWTVRSAIVALAAVASITDIRGRVVPDWLTLPPLALGLLAFALRLHWTGVALWALGIVVTAAPMLLPWLLGGMGGGDFKMAVALGALGGPLFGFSALCWSIAAGLLLFAGWAVVKGRKALRDEPPPFAVALGVGAVAALVLAVAR